MTIKSLPTENRIIRDWVSFTVQCFGSPWEVIDALGLSACAWVESPKGAHGYANRLCYESMHIHYNGRDDMGIWVEFTGKGCRAFESFSTLGWDGLFDWIADVGAHLTRLDVAFDDFSGVVPMERFVADLEDGYFVSRCAYWETVRSSKGLSAYIGSPQSAIRIRVYDKSAEQGLKPVPYDRVMVRRAGLRDADGVCADVDAVSVNNGPHWVRIELQLRDARASKFVELVQGGLSLGDAFAGVLLNYLRIVEPCGDSNRWRWAMASYWIDVVGNVERISVYEAPGVDVDLGRVKSFVIDRAGNAVDCLVQCVGVDGFIDLLRRRSCAHNPKYDIIIDSFWREADELADRVSALMGLEESDFQ